MVAPVHPLRHVLAAAWRKSLAMAGIAAKCRDLGLFAVVLRTFLCSSLEFSDGLNYPRLEQQELHYHAHGRALVSAAVARVSARVVR